MFLKKAAIPITEILSYIRSKTAESQRKYSFFLSFFLRLSHEAKARRRNYLLKRDDFLTHLNRKIVVVKRRRRRLLSPASLSGDKKKGRLKSRLFYCFSMMNLNHVKRST